MVRVCLGRCRASWRHRLASLFTGAASRSQRQGPQPLAGNQLIAVTAETNVPASSLRSAASIRASSAGSCATRRADVRGLFIDQRAIKSGHVAPEASTPDATTQLPLSDAD